ncbi:MAG: hypothetical protein QOE74_6349 [Mycobacterium sp.]|jgi:hypothetical protein|nr:hypothetical protein [Mycobacterium sp.]
MSDVWKSVDFFLPSALSRDEVSTQLHADVLRFASDGGEFVRQIRILGAVGHPGGWKKWNTSYLVGPPGVLRAGPMQPVS